MVRHAVAAIAALAAPVRRRLPAAVLTALLLSALLPAAARADEVTSYSYDVEETFTITIDAQGNARFKDVLKYDADFFNTNGFDFEQYPFLLSRRYKARAAVDEIQDFKADLDRQNATVTLTFAQRGKAYNMGDHWTVYGFYAKPAFAGDGKQVFQEESTVNSEYTLWQDLEFKTTTVVKLPPGATNARWDQGDSALTYKLAYTAPPQGNVVQTNQSVFIPLFAVLAAGSLVVGAVALVNARRKPAAQPAATGEAAREPAPGPAAAPPVLAQSAAGFGFSPAATGPSAAREGEPAAAGAEGPAATGPSAVATTPPSGSTTGTSAAAGGDPSAGAGVTPAPPAADEGQAAAGVPAQAAASVASGPIAAGTGESATASVEPAAAAAAAAGSASGAAAAEGPAHFCRHCGAALDHPDCRFCPSCGGRLSD